jgi:hypothetical protein
VVTAGSNVLRAITARIEAAPYASRQLRPRSKPPLATVIVREVRQEFCSAHSPSQLFGPLLQLCFPLFEIDDLSLLSARIPWL